MESKRLPTTTVNSRTSSSERGRNVTGGRRGTKKDTPNSELSSSNVSTQNKDNEEVNVLRTRSGRTRAATNLNNTVTTSRKKTTTLSMTKLSSTETITTKVTKDISSAIAENKIEPGAKIETNVQDDKVCLYIIKRIYYVVCIEIVILLVLLFL